MITFIGWFLFLTPMIALYIVWTVISIGDMFFDDYDWFIPWVLFHGVGSVWLGAKILGFV